MPRITAYDRVIGMFATSEPGLRVVLFSTVFNLTINQSEAVSGVLISCDITEVTDLIWLRYHAHLEEF